jgi:ABC-type multidrug transport system fused ATPase/permease subunit
VNLPAWRYFFRFAVSPQATRRLALSLLLSTLQALLVLAVAWMIRLIFNEGIPSGQSAQILSMGLLLVALYLLASVLDYQVRRLLSAVLRAQTAALRLSLLDELLAAPRRLLTGADWGRMQSILVWDTERLHRLGEAISNNLATAALLSAGLSLFLLVINPALFLVTACVFPALFFFSRFGAGKLHAFSQQHQQAMHDYQRGMLIAIQRLELTHLQSAEAQERAEKAAMIDQVGESARRLFLAKAAQFLRQQNTLLLIGVVVLIAGGIQVAQGRMQLGDLVTFYAGVVLLRPALQTITTAIIPLVEGCSALLSVYHLHSSFGAPVYRGERPPNAGGEIRFEALAFSHRQAPLLQQVDLSLAPASLTVISGPNGSGKTTLAHLLVGFYRPQQGLIRIDGVPLEQLDIAALRRQIAIVSQSPLLFPGTVRENLVYGLEGVSTEQVVQAARLAAADEFIQALPQGYDTLVGEQGILLSGGQRQRLSLARALLRRPRLLILDEPTNHLDETTARRFLDGLQDLPGRPTILLITHRQELLPQAAARFELRGGRLLPYQEPHEPIAQAELQSIERN